MDPPCSRADDAVVRLSGPPGPAEHALLDSVNVSTGGSWYPELAPGDVAVAARLMDLAWRLRLGVFAHGALVGHVGLVDTVDFDPWPPPLAGVELAKLMTHPHHQGRGVASALVRAALAGVTQGHVVWLRALADTGAPRLYARLGFAPAARYVLASGRPVLVMVREIGRRDTPTGLVP